ncbi:hypothetical protein [Glycomyces sp. NPDC048151]|uniref:hypothetical protein n=1 Tax=Glycomyces sp. NPDC048151 TaxID=3364002 RepID=UPI00371F7967
MHPSQIPPERLAELYGRVVTPEEAGRHYRRHGWILAAGLWALVLMNLAGLVLFRAFGSA